MSSNVKIALDFLLAEAEAEPPFSERKRELMRIIDDIRTLESRSDL